MILSLFHGLHHYPGLHPLLDPHGTLDPYQIWQVGTWASGSLSFHYML